jgi:CRISPR/Cas system-associated endoribonuclease Cas2
MTIKKKKNSQNIQQIKFLLHKKIKRIQNNDFETLLNTPNV